MSLTPGYRLHSGKFLTDLHRLISAFLAIGPVRRYAISQDDPLIKLQNRCTEDEIVHLLVSTAVMNRLQLEHMHRLRTDPTEMSFPPLEGHCGALWPEADSEQEVPLQFREACNKIIHAKTIEIFDEERPVLRLIGDLGRREWMAIIEVIDYVRLSVRNFDDALL